MKASRRAHKVFDVLAGKRFYRTWLEQSLDALRTTAEGRPPGPVARPDETNPSH